MNRLIDMRQIDILLDGLDKFEDNAVNWDPGCWYKVMVPDWRKANRNRLAMSESWKKRAVPPPADC